MKLNLNTFELTDTLASNGNTTVKKDILEIEYSYTDEGETFFLKESIPLLWTDIQRLEDYFNVIVPALKKNNGRKNIKFLPSYIVLILVRWLAKATNIKYESYYLNYFCIYLKRSSVKIKVPVKNVPMTIGAGHIWMTRFNGESGLEEIMADFGEVLTTLQKSLDTLNPILFKIKTEHADIQK